MRVEITLPGVADVIADLEGCGWVEVTIGGKLRQLVLKIYSRLGITWTPPR